MKRIIKRITDKTFLKYVLSAVTSFLLDLALFQLFIIILKGVLPDSYIVVSTIAARIISSVYNFIINRKIVFRSTSKVSSDVIKYYVLSVCQMFASSFSVHFLCMVINIYEIIIKFIVDIILFLISYRIQKKYVFKKN